jgi:transcriptional regulator with XRE-family HTH domain
MEISTRLLTIRKILKMNQQEFAKSISITQGALSKIEANQTIISIETVLGIAKAHNVSPNWLLLGIGSTFLESQNISIVAESQEVYGRNSNNKSLREILEAKNEVIEAQKKQIMMLEEQINWYKNK